ncbi:protein of unknown function [Mesotoga infera]|uniref:Uncharacterized protein n=1 Tax=Mesotoga infera TaxID=1236046 RepID=A0A7Z7LEN9_9BACT|nr:protein of unknown function [Mesotoga infera]
MTVEETQITARFFIDLLFVSEDESCYLSEKPLSVRLL